MTYIPGPMKNPCEGCGKRCLCPSAGVYKCPRFHSLFVRSWDETVTFLREQLRDELP